MDLSYLGWTPFFEDVFQTYNRPDLTPARVIRQDRQRYLVQHHTHTCSATPLGRMQFQETDPAQYPVVGDWVAVQVFDDDQAIIHTVLPRTSKFSRKQAGKETREQVLAANIDLAFLVSGLDGDFNLRRIERYVLQASTSGARPVIVLNKSDVCTDLAGVKQQVHRIAPGIEVIAVSGRLNQNIDSLRARIKPGQTAAFFGSSGVGKSTIINRLLEVEYMATRNVREDDSRGRHTTTHRELLILPGGGLVIDTPGLRELQLWSETQDLGAVFSDIEALATRCRFRDCTHDTEPGCAVKEALQKGGLEPDRFESYRKLKREMAYLDLQQNEVERIRARQRDKQFGRLRAQYKRHNPKR